VQREGVNVRFFSGDGVVKNVPENKAAVFEVNLLALVLIYSLLIILKLH
jgi:hypothetical protein